MRIPAGLLLVAVALAGCAESQVAGSLFYLPPYKFDDLDCAALKAKAGEAAGRAATYEELRNKAGAQPAGGAVGAMVYTPDHQRAAWDKKLYEQEYARKRCTDAPAAIAPAPQTAVIPR